MKDAMTYRDAGVDISKGNEAVDKTVSYTHLTLPTILLV